MRKLLLPIFLFTALRGGAQRMLSLEEAIATALQNNFDIRLAKNDSMLAALDYSFRNAALLPRLNANLGGTWNNNAQKQRFNDGTERELNDIRSNTINMGVQLNWTLFDGMKMFANNWPSGLRASPHPQAADAVARHRACQLAPLMDLM